MNISQIIKVSLLWGLMASGAMADHIVRSGDTLTKIAKKNNTSVQRIMAFNRSIRNANKLRVGQIIRLPKSSSKSYTLRRNQKKKPIIVLDPGHGGRDKGAYWYGVRESALNLDTARRVASKLRKKGYKVIMTRNSDAYVALGRRSMIANQYPNAVFVSIHYNASTQTNVTGGETYHAGHNSIGLARAIQGRLVRYCKLKNRGVRFARYAVLRQTRHPAILVECGFISNRAEAKRCNTAHYKATAAQAISDGLHAYVQTY